MIRLEVRRSYNLMFRYLNKVLEGSVVLIPDQILILVRRLEWRMDKAVRSRNLKVPFTQNEMLLEILIPLNMLGLRTLFRNLKK